MVSCLKHETKSDFDLLTSNRINIEQSEVNDAILSF